MKSLSVAFLIIGTLAARSYADCIYFRVSAKLLTCAAIDPKTIQDSSDTYDAQDLPELAEQPKNVVQAKCECAYSLHNADVRCDLDQTIERSALIDADDPDRVCRRGNSLCHNVCPSNLP